MKESYLRIVMMLMLISYFYNIDVLEYSISGNNYLKMFTIVGLGVVYESFVNIKEYLRFFKQNKVAKALFYFTVWAIGGFFLSIIYNILLGDYIWSLRNLLLIYHLYVFVFSYFIWLMRFNGEKFKVFIWLVVILIGAEAILVIMQNLGMAPILWASIYLEHYGEGFTGTLGLNRIVLGLTMFMSFVIVNRLNQDEKRTWVKILYLALMVLTLVVIVLSGSRTSYLATLLYFGYLLIKAPMRIIQYAVGISFLIFVLVATTDIGSQVFDEVVEVVENRTVNKAHTFADDQSLGALYHDLGSNRDELSLRYIKLLFSNWHILPTGAGFNNLNFWGGASAHNMYLNIIAELGLIGFFLYFRWLIFYFIYPKSNVYVQGLVFAMLVTLLFGEHLYVYRPLYALLGFFMFTTIVLEKQNQATSSV